MIEDTEDARMSLPEMVDEGKEHPIITSLILAVLIVLDAWLLQLSLGIFNEDITYLMALGMTATLLIVGLVPLFFIKNPEKWHMSITIFIGWIGVVAWMIMLGIGWIKALLLTLLFGTIVGLSIQGVGLMFLLYSIILLYYYSRRAANEMEKQLEETDEFIREKEEKLKEYEEKVKELEEARKE